MSNQIVSYVEMPLDKLGAIFVKSGFFADSRDEAQAVVKILAGKELGFGPIASMTGVNIIKGRVSLSANLIASAIKRSTRYNYRILTPPAERHLKCEIEFFESGKECGRSLFTQEDAKRAGLTGDNWTKYPANMLFARAISNGAKWYCPDIFGGPIFTPDELGAAIDGETGEVIEIHASEPTPSGNGLEPEPLPALTLEEACQMTTKDGRKFENIEYSELEEMLVRKQAVANPLPELQRQLQAIQLILESREVADDAARIAESE